MHSRNKDFGLTDLWQHRQAMGCLPPEVDHQGNIEYKLKLVDPSEVRMEHLITQLKWRLAEGSGQALYELGVNDDGSLTGLSNQDMSATLDTLRRMAEALNAEVSIVREIKISQLIEDKIDSKLKKLKQLNKKKGSMDNQQKQVAENEEDQQQHGRCIIEALVRQRTPIDVPSYTDVRMAIVGDTGSGKSTFLAHISHGIKDTGHGTARISLLRHPHEIETGNTSSIAHEMIGYTAEGNLVNNATCSMDQHDDNLFNDSLDTSSWEHICATSSKVVTFLDTCGHPKYMRTTISALTGYAPDYALLVVSATLGSSAITEMTREHVSLVFMLDVPLCVVITKIDLASNDQIQQCIQALQAFLSSAAGVRHRHRLPILVAPESITSKAKTTRTTSHHHDQDASMTTKVTEAAMSMLDDSCTIPIFLVSNVTGAHMNLVHQFLNVLPKPAHKNNGSVPSLLSSQNLLEEAVEFQIEQVYRLPQVGIVVGGVLRQGRINTSDPVSQRTFALGPNGQGDFIQATVVSIHRHRMSSHYVHAGQTATLAIELRASFSVPTTVEVDEEGDVEKQELSQHYHQHKQRQHHHHDHHHRHLHHSHWGKIKKGMVLLAASNHNPPESYTVFKANVLVLYHATGLRKGTCGMIRSGFVRQQARVIDIEMEQTMATISTDKQQTLTEEMEITSGHQGICTFQLLGDPEYLRLNAQFLFMEGSFKCLGSVTKLVGKVHGKWIR